MGDLGRRFIEKKQPSLEAQLANLADEIAYNNHDVDDGLRYGLIDIVQLREIELFADQRSEVEKLYPNLEPRRGVHETIRRMINHVVVDLIENSAARIASSEVRSIDDVRDFGERLIAYSTGVGAKVLRLKQFLRQNLYSHYRVKRMSRKATRIIKDLFAVFMEDTRFLPPQYQHKIATAGTSHDSTDKARIIADYIAGMTDRYAIREHARLFNPTELT